MSQSRRGRRPSGDRRGGRHVASARDTRRFAVDRVEGRTVVLIGDDENERPLDVDARRLPHGCASEGAVLDVPVAPDGALRWEEAVRNRAEEQRRFEEARLRLERLHRADDGGDVAL